MKLNDVIARIYELTDEVGAEYGVLESSNRGRMVACVDIAVRRLKMDVSLDLLDRVVVDNSVVERVGQDVCRVVCPVDYLRLAFFKMKEWRRGVSRVVLEGTMEYDMQQNVSTRGGRSKPVVAQVGLGAGRCLEAYSCGRIVERFEYVRDEVIVEGTEDIGLDDSLIDVVAGGATEVYWASLGKVPSSTEVNG